MDVIPERRSADKREQFTEAQPRSPAPPMLLPRSSQAWKALRGSEVHERSSGCRLGFFKVMHGCLQCGSEVDC